MSLAREWTRHISGASGAALLVPGAIFASLVLLALAGGFGQLGGLGQAFAGPGAPSPSSGGRPATVTAAGGTAAAPLLPVVATARGVALIAAVSGGGTGSDGSGGHRSAPGHGNSPTNPTTPSTPTRPTNPTSPTSPTSPVSPTQPTQPPSLIDGVVSLGTSITSQLPGPVGPLATQVLNDVGQTVDRELPASGGSSDTAAPPAQGSLSSTVTNTVGQVQSGVNQLGQTLHGLP